MRVEGYLWWDCFSKLVQGGVLLDPFERDETAIHDEEQDQDTLAVESMVGSTIPAPKDLRCFRCQETVFRGELALMTGEGTYRHPGPACPRAAPHRAILRSVDQYLRSVG